MCGGVTVWTHRANGISSELHSADLETGISRMTHRPQVWGKTEREIKLERQTEKGQRESGISYWLLMNIQHTQTHTSCICTHIVLCEYCVNGLVISYARHFLPFMPMCPSGTGCETDRGGVDREREQWAWLKCINLPQLIWLQINWTEHISNYWKIKTYDFSPPCRMHAHNLPWVIN